MVFDKAKAEINPLARTTGKNAPLGPLGAGAPPAGGGGENRAAGRNISGPDWRKTLVGASIARPCPLALQDNCPGKCVAAVSWRATNGRPYIRNKAGMQFFDSLRLPPKKKA